MIVPRIGFSIPPDWVYLNTKTVQDRHTQRGIEMDNKVLDEAVAMACDELAAVGILVMKNEMRAALLAGVKVLLGEPVGWLAGGRFFDSESEADYEAKWTSSIVTAVYAPSLGEGDGR